MRRTETLRPSPSRAEGAVSDSSIIDAMPTRRSAPPRSSRSGLDVSEDAHRRPGAVGPSAAGGVAPGARRSWRRWRRSVPEVGVPGEVPGVAEEIDVRPTREDQADDERLVSPCERTSPRPGPSSAEVFSSDERVLKLSCLVAEAACNAFAKIGRLDRRTAAGTLPSPRRAPR